MQSKQLRVFDKRGNQGTVIAFSPGDAADKSAIIRLENGQQLILPAEMLVRRSDTIYDIALTFEEIANLGRSTSTVAPANSQTISIPVIEEELDIQKRLVETGVVRINKSVAEREEIVEQTLRKENANIERIAIGRIVPEPSPSFYEDDTLVIPLYEEILVVEKRLLLREEIRITMKTSEEQQQQRVTLRTEEATVETVTDN